LASSTEGGTAGGGLAGAFRVAKASTNRQREEQENNIKMATANASMLHEQQLLHKTGEDAVNASLAVGKQSADEMLAAPHAETIASGKNSDELKKMIDSKVIDPSRDAIFLTGRVLTGNDQNGLPMYRSTYSVIKPGDRLKPSQENIDFLNKYLPGQDFKGPEDVEEGKESQSFDSHTYYMLNQRAMNRFADVQAIAKNTAETDDKVHKALLEKGSQELSGNQYVQAAIRDVAPVRGGDPFLFQKAFNILAREAALDPNIAKQLPKNWQQQFAYTYGGGETKKFEDQMTQLSKLQEKAQETGNDILTLYGQDPAKFGGDKLSGVQTAADNAIRQAAQIQDPVERANAIARAQNAKAMAKDQANYEANQKGAEEKARETAKKQVEITGTNGSSESGDAFLQTLPVARRTVVQGYIDGTSTWSPRIAGSKYGQALLQDIRQAAGGTWDETKGQAYAKNRLGFTSGKESIAIGAGNTSMHHLTNLWNHLDTADAGWLGKAENAVSFGHANKSGQAVADDAKAVSGELGRLYQGGVVGEKEAEEWKEKLDPFARGMSVEMLRTNVKEFMRLLGGKLQSLQNQWDDGKPSDNLNFAKGIISQDNLDAYNKITGDNLNITDIQKGPAAQQKSPAAQQQKQGGPKVGDTFVQNGHTFKVTSLNADGTVAGAE
jgi:hypothetical protein